MADQSSDKTENKLYEVSFNNDEPYGSLCEVPQVNPQGPVFIAFPGNGFEAHEMGYTLNEKALRLANKMRKYLESAGISREVIKQLPFYVASYYMPKDFSDKDARTLLYKKHGRNNMPEDVLKGENGFSDEEKNPAYIESLYQKIILPRISRLNGKIKIDADTAARNMAQVFIFAHCHGAYTALKLEEIMKKNMRQLNYTNEEIAQIQKQITVAAYAPACPLGVSKMNFISFKSLNDTITNEDYNNVSVYTTMKMDSDRANWIETHMAKKESSENAPFDFKFSFYPDALGNVFVVKQKSDYDSIINLGGDGDYFINELLLTEKEHNNVDAGVTEDSKVMHKMFINVLGNACRHAFQQAENPELLAPLAVRQLAIGTLTPKEDAEIFDKAQQAGIEQGQKIQRHIAQLLAEQRQ